MAASNFDQCIPVVLVYEGGLSMNRKDPGNWTGGKVGKGALKGTKYGIAAHSHPNLDIQSLTLDQAKEIYRREYWVPAGCSTLVHGLDLAVLDASVMSGVSRGKKWLAAAMAGPEVGVALIQKYCAQRMSFVRSLKTFVTFGKGWTRRIADVEARAVKMYASEYGKPVKDVIEKAKAEAENDAKGNASVATGTAGGGAAGGAISLEWASAHPWLIAAGAVLLMGIVLLALSRRSLNNERAAAYARVAAEG